MLDHVWAEDITSHCNPRGEGLFNVAAFEQNDWQRVYYIERDAYYVADIRDGQFFYFGVAI